MIEQTELVVNVWNYNPPSKPIPPGELTSTVTLDVMKKRAADKKGIACRFTCQFIFEGEIILEYVAGDTYVIDLPDVIDRNELHTMINNSFAKFSAALEIRKLGTVLQDKALLPFDEKRYVLEPVLAMLRD